MGVNHKGLTSHVKCCYRERGESWKNILVEKKKNICSISETSLKIRLTWWKYFS